MKEEQGSKLKTAISVIANTPKLFKLVWQTSRLCTIILGMITLVQGILPLLKLWVGKLIVDGVVNAISSQTPSDYLSRVLILMVLELGLGAITSLLGRVNGFVQNVLTELFRIHANTMVLKKSVELDLSYYETPSFYNNLQRAQQDAGNRPISVLQATFRLIQNLISGVTMIILVVRLNWIIAIGLILVTLPNFIIDLKFSQRRYFLRMYQTAEGRKAGYFSSVLTSVAYVKEVKLFGLGEYLIDKWRAVYKQFYRENRALSKKNNIAGFIVELFSTLGFYGAYGYILYKAIFKNITVGDLTMYAGAFARLQGSIQSILSEISFIYEGNLFVTNFFNFFSLEPKIINAPNAKPFPQFIREGIEFENVSFRYTEDGGMVLQDINLKIQNGESIALVGENGAGKTTLIKLLARLYDPTEGSIFVDGVDIKEVDLFELSQNIGVVFQDFARYYVPVKENIGFGNMDKMSDISRIISSAQKSGADEFINRLPQQYDTMLGRIFDGGVELSLGEWQKIALARAFMRDAQILILDEPTASLDAKTEYEIFKRFRELTEGKITVLISHRFSTVRMADRIFVIENGKIIEQGRHNELMELNGKYARMFLMQAESYK